MLTSKKKVEEMREILGDKEIKLLLVQGPPGCGKHCTLRTLGKEFGFTVQSSSIADYHVVTRKEYISANDREVQKLDKLFSLLSLANRELR